MNLNGLINRQQYEVPRWITKGIMMCRSYGLGYKKGQCKEVFPEISLYLVSSSSQMKRMEAWKREQFTTLLFHFFKRAFLIWIIKDVISYFLFKLVHDFLQ